MISPQAGNRGRDNDRRISASGPAAPSGIGPEKTTGEETAFRVLIADDHPLMVGGLRCRTGAAPDAEIAVAHDFDSMVAALTIRQTPTSCCST